MSRFKLKRHLLASTGGGSGGVSIYDTSIGNGVDTAGFADLPLNPGGSDGSDLATATPTLGGATAYNSGTRTLSTSFSTGLSATWAGILTPSTTYRMRITFNITSVSGNNIAFYVSDQSGHLNTPRIDVAPIAGEIDISFTTSASGTDFTIASNTQMLGSVTIVSVTQHTASLPGRRFYVSNSGADTHTSVEGKSPSTPYATIAKALTYVQGGRGDQIMVAEGSSFDAGLPLLSTQSGLSAVYPLVFQSYDPADPTNEAKFGRASGSNRPRINTGGHGATQLTNSLSTTSYLAFRGFKFDPGDVAGQSADFTAGSPGTVSYVLFENNIFANQALSFDLQGHTAANGQHFIFRNNAQWGSWAGGGHWEPLFASHIDNVTLEDNVLYHGGWRVGTSRDADISVGGLVGDDIFRHTYYSQNTNFGTIYRRNLIIEGPSDGGHLLGDVDAYENLIIDCPIALDMPGGANWPTTRPGGVDKQVHYNAVVGSQDNTTALTRGFGFAGGISNTSSGSSAHHNLLVRVKDISNFNRVTFSTMATLNTPSYMAFHDNVSYLRSIPGKVWTEFSDKDLDEQTPTPQPSPNFHPLSILHTSYTNNIWDDPTDGNGNVQSTAGMFPTPYTDDELYVAAGYTGADAAARRQAMIDYVIANPEAHPGRALYNLVMAGYGISHSI